MIAPSKHTDPVLTSEEYFPTAHDGHEDCPVVLVYFPGEHVVHEMAAAAEYWPCAQAGHEDATGSEYLPAAQFTHAVCPAVP